MFNRKNTVLFLKPIFNDFPAFALFSHTNIQMFDGTFCRIEVPIISHKNLQNVYC